MLYGQLDTILSPCPRISTTDLSRYIQFFSAKYISYGGNIATSYCKLTLKGRKINFFEFEHLYLVQLNSTLEYRESLVTKLNLFKNAICKFYVLSIDIYRLYAVLANDALTA